MSFLPLYNIARIKDTKDLPKIAEVINNSDPKGLGRIKVKLDGMFDPSDKSGSNLPWIRKMRSEMGIGIDEKNIPMVGDKVEIIWPYDNKHAFYRGLPFGDSSKVSSLNYDWGWSTSNGFNFLLNKSTNDFLISNPNCTITVDGDGNLVIHTSQTINVEAQSDVILTSQGATQITATGNTNITSTSNVAITGSNVAVTGSNVTISGNTKIDNKVFLSHTHSNGNDGRPTGGVI